MRLRLSVIFAIVAGVLFFYTHGHHYGVKRGSERLAQCAGDRGADVALFGHTHVRELQRGVGTAATVFNNIGSTIISLEAEMALRLDPDCITMTPIPSPSSINHPPRRLIDWLRRRMRNSA